MTLISSVLLLICVDGNIKLHQLLEDHLLVLKILKSNILVEMLTMSNTTLSRLLLLTYKSLGDLRLKRQKLCAHLQKLSWDMIWFLSRRYEILVELLLKNFYPKSIKKLQTSILLLSVNEWGEQTLRSKLPVFIVMINLQNFNQKQSQTEETSGSVNLMLFGGIHDLAHHLLKLIHLK